MRTLVVAGKIGPLFDVALSPAVKKAAPRAGVAIVEVNGGNTYERGYFGQRTDCLSSLLGCIDYDLLHAYDNEDVVLWPSIAR